MAGTLVVVVGPSAELEGQVRSAAAGYTVRVSPDVDAALERARIEGPAALVLSADLERGFAICRRIKRDPALAALHLVLVSERATDQELNDHARLPTRADAYLRLPADRAGWVAALALPPLPPPLPDDALLFALEPTPRPGGDYDRHDDLLLPEPDPAALAAERLAHPDLELPAPPPARVLAPVPPPVVAPPLAVSSPAGPAPTGSVAGGPVTGGPVTGGFETTGSPSTASAASSASIAPEVTPGADDDDLDAILGDFDPFPQLTPPPSPVASAHDPVDEPSWDLARETRLGATDAGWGLEQALADDGPSGLSDAAAVSAPPEPPALLHMDDLLAPVEPEAGQGRRNVAGVVAESARPSRAGLAPNPQPGASPSGVRAGLPDIQWDPNEAPRPSSVRGRPPPAEAAVPDVTRLTTALMAARAETDALRRERDQLVARNDLEREGARRAEESFERELEQLRVENEQLRSGAATRSSEAKVVVLKAEKAELEAEAHRYRALYADARETLVSLHELMALARDAAARHAELASLAD